MPRVDHLRRGIGIVAVHQRRHEVRLQCAHERSFAGEPFAGLRRLTHHRRVVRPRHQRPGGDAVLQIRGVAVALVHQTQRRDRNGEEERVHPDLQAQIDGKAVFVVSGVYVLHRWVIQIGHIEGQAAPHAQGAAKTHAHIDAHSGLYLELEVHLNGVIVV